MPGNWTVQPFQFEPPEPPQPPEPAQLPEPPLAAGLDARRAPERRQEPVAQPGSAPDLAISVSDLYARMRIALREAFPAEIWVTGEIRKVVESKGHRFVELSDHVAATGGRGSSAPGGPYVSYGNRTYGYGSGYGPPDRVVQCLEIACWARDWPAINRQLRDAGIDLAPGLVVRVRGRLSVWEGTGKLRFTMSAIDIEALLGGIAAARRRLLNLLGREGLLERNRSLPTPLVPLRVGIVTSAGSEAHRDFAGQLERSGHAFETHLQASLVQGPDAPRQIARALRRLEDVSPDVVVIVRGGGGRVDLAAFDDEVVARSIARAPFPVWTGIGHTGDRSVADEVAARSYITPTACGEALVGRVSEYWDTVVRSAGTLSRQVRGQLDLRSARLANSSQHLRRAVAVDIERHESRVRTDARRAVSAAGYAIGRAESVLRGRAVRLAGETARAVAASGERLRTRTDLLRAYDPGRQLARGWTLTRDESGAIVRAARDLSPGTKIVTEFSDGTAASTVDGVDPDGGRAHPDASVVGGAAALGRP